MAFEVLVVVGENMQEGDIGVLHSLGDRLFMFKMKKGMHKMPSGKMMSDKEMEKMMGVKGAKAKKKKKR